PPAYIKALEQGPSAVRITHDAEGNPLLHYPGDYNVAVRGHRDIDYREQVLKDTRVDTQIITLTTPGTHIEEPATAARLASLVNDMEAVMYIHPTDPVGVEAMLEYWLMPLVGFLFDTTLAAAGLVFSGVAERFPRIRWVLGHLGGAIPYLAERLDRGYEAFEDC